MGFLNPDIEGISRTGEAVGGRPYILSNSIQRGQGPRSCLRLKQNLGFDSRLSIGQRVMAGAPLRSETSSLRLRLFKWNVGAISFKSPFCVPSV